MTGSAETPHSVSGPAQVAVTGPTLAWGVALALAWGMLVAAVAVDAAMANGRRGVTLLAAGGTLLAVLTVAGSVWWAARWVVAQTRQQADALRTTLAAMTEPARTPAKPRHRWGPASRQPRRATVWALAVAGAFALCQLPAAPGQLTPDSAQYLAHSLTILGHQSGEARDLALVELCASRHRADRLVNLSPTGRVADGAGAAAAADCVARERERGPSHPRYEAIFRSRPGVALAMAPGVWLLGPRWGLWATSLLWTLAGALLAFHLLRVAGLASPLAALGEALFLALPSGRWAMAPLAEGPTLALAMVALLGAAHLLAGRGRLGAGLLAAALAAGLTVKYSQFLLLAACLSLAAGVGWLLGRRAGEPTGRLARLAVASGAGALAIAATARLLGWPGAGESAQDLLTSHFSRPDVVSPAYQVARLNAYFWSWWAVQQLAAPLAVASWLVSGWAAWRARPLGLALLGAAAAGLANQAGHPVASQGDRLYVLVWPVVALGLPLLVDQLGVVARSARDAHPNGWFRST